MNPFDQFDSPGGVATAEPVVKPSGKNPFDQFDYEIEPDGIKALAMAHSSGAHPEVIRGMESGLVNNLKSPITVPENSNEDAGLEAHYNRNEQFENILRHPELVSPETRTQVEDAYRQFYPAYTKQFDPYDRASMYAVKFAKDLARNPAGRLGSAIAAPFTKAADAVTAVVKPAGEAVGDLASAVKGDVPLSKAGEDIKKAGAAIPAQALGLGTGIDDLIFPLGLGAATNLGGEVAGTLSPQAEAEINLAKFRAGHAYEAGAEKLRDLTGSPENFDAARFAGGFALPLGEVGKAIEPLSNAAADAVVSGARTIAGKTVEAASMPGVRKAVTAHVKAVAGKIPIIGRVLKPAMAAAGDATGGFFENVGNLGKYYAATPAGVSFAEHYMMTGPQMVTEANQLLEVAKGTAPYTNEVDALAVKHGFNQEERIALSKGGSDAAPVREKLASKIGAMNNAMRAANKLYSLNLNGVLTRNTARALSGALFNGGIAAGMTALPGGSAEESADSAYAGAGLSLPLHAVRPGEPTPLNKAVAEGGNTPVKYGTPLDALHEQAVSNLSAEQQRAINQNRLARVGQNEVYYLNEPDFVAQTGSNGAGVTRPNPNGGLDQLLINADHPDAFGHELGHTTVEGAPIPVTNDLRQAVRDAYTPDEIETFRQEYNRRRAADQPEGAEAPAEITTAQAIDEIISDHTQKLLEGQSLRSLGLPKQLSTKISDLAKGLAQKTGVTSETTPMGVRQSPEVSKQIETQLRRTTPNPFVPVDTSNPAAVRGNWTPPSVPVAGETVLDEKALSPLETAREKLHTSEDEALADDKRTFGKRSITSPMTASAADDVLAGVVKVRDGLASGEIKTAEEADAFLADYLKSNGTERGQQYFDSLSPEERHALVDAVIDNPKGVFDFLSTNPTDIQPEPSKDEIVQQLGGTPFELAEAARPKTPMPQPYTPEQRAVAEQMLRQGFQPEEVEKTVRSLPIEGSNPAGANPGALSKQTGTPKKMFENAAKEGYQPPQGGIRRREIARKDGKVQVTHEGQFVQPELQPLVAKTNTQPEIRNSRVVENALRNGFDNAVEVEYNSTVDDETGKPIKDEKGKVERKLADKVYLPGSVGINDGGKLYFKGFSIDKLSVNLDRAFKDAAKLGVSLPYKDVGEAWGDIPVYLENQRRGYGGAGDVLEGQAKPEGSAAGTLEIGKRDFINWLLGLNQADVNPLVNEFKKIGFISPESTYRNLRQDQVASIKPAGKMEIFGPTYKSQKQNFSPVVESVPRGNAPAASLPFIIANPNDQK